MDNTTAIEIMACSFLFARRVGPPLIELNELIKVIPLINLITFFALTN